MTIIFASNDIADFQGALISTDSADRRTAYVSEAFEVSNGSGDRLHTSFTFFGEVAGDITWVHFQYRKVLTTNGNNADGQVMLSMLNSVGGNVFYFNITNGSWQLVVNGNASSTFADPTGTTLRSIDFKIDLTGGANAVVDFYVDEVLAKTHTAAYTGGNPSALFWRGHDMTNTSDQSHETISEFIVADEDTQNFGLSDMSPDAAGNYSAWIGNHIQTGDSDLGVVVVTDATGDKLSSDLSTFNGPASSALKALVITNHASVRGGTVGDIRNFLRINSTDYDGVAFGAGEAPQAFINVFLTNPDTASDWDTTDFSGVEIGIESLV